MIPAASTFVPTMKPGTSTRNTSGIPKASQSVTKRAALSAESLSSTPPRWGGGPAGRWGGGGARRPPRPPPPPPPARGGGRFGARELRLEVQPLAVVDD